MYRRDCNALNVLSQVYASKIQNQFSFIFMFSFSWNTEMFMFCNKLDTKDNKCFLEDGIWMTDIQKRKYSHCICMIKGMYKTYIPWYFLMTSFLFYYIFLDYGKCLYFHYKLSWLIRNIYISIMMIFNQSTEDLIQ